MILIKNKEQIDGIRASCQLASFVLNETGKLVKPGISTEFLNNFAANLMKESGALPATLNYKHPSVQVPFPKETCISINEVVCHGISNPDILLKEGDIVKIDITTILNGFYGDTCRTFRVGEVNEKAHFLIYHTQKALEIGIQAAKEGKRFGEIGFQIGKYSRKNKYKVVISFTGHGVGINFHESPSIFHDCPKESGDIIKRGMIFTIEPMLCIGDIGVKIDENDHWTARMADGKIAAQFEHTVLINPQTGLTEVLTKMEASNGNNTGQVF